MDLDLTAVTAAVDAAAPAFSGVVSVAVGRETVLERSLGLAHRGHRVPVSPETRFAMASGSKGFTALAVMRLVEDGVLSLQTPVRQHLGDDLPLVDDAVTVEHLLGHTSGIGDYLDESELAETDYVLSRPIHTYTGAEAFLPDLAGRPQVSAPGERYAYNNGGYLVLALVAARASGRDFHELVRSAVLAPAGMTRTDFLRSDRLPGDAAVGYLDAEGDFCNVLHLPVLGGGDGGAYTTAGDMLRFWHALHDGRIVSPETVELMSAPRHLDEEEGLRHGLGIWRHATGPAVLLEGADAGVAFRSTHVPAAGLTVTVMGNTGDDAWPVIGAIAELLG